MFGGMMPARGQQHADGYSGYTEDGEATAARAKVCSVQAY